MSKLSVLIIDNNRPRMQSLSLLLGFMDFQTYKQTSIEPMNESESAVDLILFGDKSLSHFLPELLILNKTFPQIPFIILKNSEELPLDAIKQQYPLCLGIFDEPFKQEHFLELSHVLLDTHESSINHDNEATIVVEPKDTSTQHSAQNSTLNSNSGSYLNTHFIGQSTEILRVKKLIQQVSHSNANVLILGESGTGKEVVANCIHSLSSRKDHAYVPVNCGAIPGELLESELFGHEKGAFTGAISARQGRFELAQGGTLFLDEIGDMPLTMQVKLLRVLQEKIFERVGGIKSLQANVRVLAATHRNLDQHVDEGKFREDLFYRLNVFPIELPALRERVTDIPLLVNVFNQQIKIETGETVSFSDEAMASLFLHSWPGNVRELGNLVERLSIIFLQEEVQYDDLPDKYKYDIADFNYDLLIVDEIEQIDNIPPVNTVAESSTDVNEVEQLESKQENKTKSEDENSLLSTSDVNILLLDSESSEHQKDIISLPDDGSFDLKEHLSNLEQNLIQDALNKSSGVVAHAAKRLNIRRTTLVEKMRKYGI